MKWSTAYRGVATVEIRANLTRSVKAEFDRIHRAELAEWLAGGKQNKSGDPCPPPTAIRVTRLLIGDVEQALAGYCLLDGRAVPPAWLIKEPPFPAIEAIPFKNCVLHLPGWVSGAANAQGNASAAPVAVQPTPGYFAMHALNYDFDPQAPEPVEWLRFLGTLWPNDRESIDTLQEFLGHLLVPDTSYQKILMLIGPRRSGKGTIARVLRGMLGPENTCHPTLSSLSTQFGMQPMIGKLVAIVGDARLSGRSDMAAIVETLLSVSGEDTKTVDIKYQAALTTNLYARFVVLSNEVPRLVDSSGALASRMIVLRLTTSFLGKEDRSLTGRLLTELPGILLWAVRGWRRLTARGAFVQPTSARAEVDLLQDLGSPVGAYVRERCVVGPEYSVEIATLFRDWQEWCHDNNRVAAGDAHHFGRDLRAVIPDVVVSQPRRDGKRRPRRYSGVGLQPPENN